MEIIGINIPEEIRLEEIKEIIASFKRDKAEFEANRMDLTNPTHQTLWASYNDAISFWEQKAQDIIRKLN